MKELTYNEKVEKVAKYLIKKYNTSNDKSIINISGCLYQQYNRDDKTYTTFGRTTDVNKPIIFGVISDEAVGNLTCDIAKYIVDNIKVGKKVFKYVHKREKYPFYSYSYMSSKYYIADNICFIEPCKEFSAINKKLVKLGLKEIDINNWWYGQVFGKRSDYSIISKTYYATSKESCDKVLNYLKGKKRLSYEMDMVKNLGNMDYGVEYETEWSGSIINRIKFTDSKGKVETF